jgi:hypothetical protein
MTQNPSELSNEELEYILRTGQVPSRFKSEHDPPIHTDSSNAAVADTKTLKMGDMLNRSSIDPIHSPHHLFKPTAFLTHAQNTPTLGSAPSLGKSFHVLKKPDISAWPSRSEYSSLPHSALSSNRFARDSKKSLAASQGGRSAKFGFDSGNLRHSHDMHQRLSGTSPSPLRTLPPSHLSYSELPHTHALDRIIHKHSAANPVASATSHSFSHLLLPNSQKERDREREREVEREKERENLTPNIRQSTQNKKEAEIELMKLSDHTHNVTLIDKEQQRLFPSLSNIQTDLSITQQTLKNQNLNSTYSQAPNIDSALSNVANSKGKII